MKYDYCLFDFDGTVCDTGDGIMKSIAWALDKLGYPALTDAQLRTFIGPPLHDSFIRECGMTAEQATETIATYRERYLDVGLYESYIYPGMAQLLRALKASGAYIAIASAKPTIMIERLVAHFGLSRYIDRISGTTLGRHSSDKRDLILSALPEGADLSRVCMAGDRKYDIEAAKALDICAIGAGYGYAPEGELEASGADFVFPTVRAMADHMLDGAIPKGKFISLEGTDGCGKSTQLELVRQYLAERGFEIVMTREPGGCPIGERIREIILSPDSKGMSSECEALLYAASRVEHVRNVIVPALNEGKIVISDRFLDSSIAYQAFGRELGEDFVRQINSAASHIVEPDLTILLEADRARAKQRMVNGAPPDRLEMEKDDFFERVRLGYECVKASAPDRVRAVDANRSIEDVFLDVRAALEAALDLSEEV